MAPFPTEHLPGTLGKLIVMEWRDDSGFGLYHPNDAAEDPRPSIETSYWPHWSHLDLRVHQVHV
jgi:hypothetical protein